MRGSVPGGLARGGLRAGVPSSAVLAEVQGGDGRDRHPSSPAARSQFRVYHEDFRTRNGVFALCLVPNKSWQALPQPTDMRNNATSDTSKPKRSSKQKRIRELPLCARIHEHSSPDWYTTDDPQRRSFFSRHRGCAWRRDRRRTAGRKYTPRGFIPCLSPPSAE